MLEDDGFDAFIAEVAGADPGPTIDEFAETAVLEIDFDTYKAIGRMNASTLVHGDKSMRSLFRAINGKSKAATNAMQFGNKYHTLILEPEEFEDSFVVMPDFSTMPQNVTSKGDPSTSWATSFCKDSVADFNFQADLDGKQVITQAEYDKAMEMLQSIVSTPRAVEIIRSSRRELTLFCEIDDVPMKCRIDLCGKSLADLKGTNDATPSKFGRTCANMRYDFKMAIYREAFKQNFSYVPKVELIAVETQGDFDCVVYPMPEEILDAGFVRVRNVIRQYKECLDSGVWPGIDRGRRTVDLAWPVWGLPEEDSDDGLDWGDSDE